MVLVWDSLFGLRTLKAVFWYSSALWPPALLFSLETKKAVMMVVWNISLGCGLLVLVLSTTPVGRCHSFMTWSFAYFYVDVMKCNRIKLWLTGYVIHSILGWRSFKLKVVVIFLLLFNLIFLLQPRRRQGCKVLFWACLYVCVYLLAYVKNDMSKLHEIFCTWRRVCP